MKNEKDKNLRREIFLTIIIFIAIIAMILGTVLLIRSDMQKVAKEVAIQESMQYAATTTTTTKVTETTAITTATTTPVTTTTTRSQVALPEETIDPNCPEEVANELCLMAHKVLGIYNYSIVQWDETMWVEGSLLFLTEDGADYLSLEGEERSRIFQVVKKENAQQYCIDDPSQHIDYDKFSFVIWSPFDLGDDYFGYSSYWGMWPNQDEIEENHLNTEIFQPRDGWILIPEDGI